MRSIEEAGHVFRGLTETKLPWLFRLLRYVVFLMGDLRWLGWDKFPFVIGWYSWEDKITKDEVIEEALPVLQPGDVILHRTEGYLSNLFIGGAMIHAGLAVNKQHVVEALSEGVVCHHANYILEGDYSIVLRPRLDPVAIANAVSMAYSITGFSYDYYFDFNGEKERELIAQYGPEAKHHGVRFCCTEVPYFCYLDYLERLKVTRRRNVSLLTWLLARCGFHTGEWVVDADIYVTAEMDVVWCSRSLTPAWAQARGASPEYVAKIAAYWASRS